MWEEGLSCFSPRGHLITMPRILDLLPQLAGAPLQLPLNDRVLPGKSSLGGSNNLSPLVRMAVEEQGQSDFLHHGGGETQPMQAVRLPCQGEN